MEKRIILTEKEYDKLVGQPSDFEAECHRRGDLIHDLKDEIRSLRCENEFHRYKWAEPDEPMSSGDVWGISIILLVLMGAGVLIGYLI